MKIDTQRGIATAVALATLGMLAVDGCAPVETGVGEPPPVADVGSVQQASVSCEQWTDTGYVDGDPFTITLVTVDGKPVEISTANAYVVMQEAAAADGVSIVVVSGFRTWDEQDYFYGCYQCCCCNNCNLAAAPGYSNHQSGHALDLNTSAGSVLSWLNEHGAGFGFERTVPSESWHWEYWGGGPGGGPCVDNAPGTACTVTATGESGECMDTAVCQSLGGSHVSTPGYCPGPANIQCCTGSTACTVAETGLSGECLRTSACAALGADYVTTPGYCSGPSDFQCCTPASAPPGGGGAGGEGGGGQTALGGAVSTEGIDGDGGGAASAPGALAAEADGGCSVGRAGGGARWWFGATFAAIGFAIRPRRRKP